MFLIPALVCFAVAFLLSQLAKDQPPVSTIPLEILLSHYNTPVQ